MYKTPTIERDLKEETTRLNPHFGCRNLDAVFSVNKCLSRFNATSQFSLPFLAMSSSSSLDLAPSLLASPTRKLGFCRRTFGLEMLRFGSTRSRSLRLPKINCDCDPNPGKNRPLMSTVEKSTNIVWQDCPVGKLERQKLLKQKGCVIWITGLSGSGKSTLACALSRELHGMGYLTYVLDGDNIRHGLNRDLSFKAEDRAENIRRVGEVAKLFADAGVICIASLISPYRRDRDACRALLPDSNFIEVFMDISIEVCESRDPKGLYKLARAGKIKGFTGIDDPYERPLNCEIVMRSRDGVNDSPTVMAEQVISYLDLHGFLKA